MSKFCKNCGALLEDYINVCGYCGTPCAPAKAVTEYTNTHYSSESKNVITSNGKYTSYDKTRIINTTNKVKNSTNNALPQQKQNTSKPKGKQILLQIVAVVLALVIFASGSVGHLFFHSLGVLVCKSVFNSDSVEEVFEDFDSDKKVSSVDRNIADTNDSDFTFYKSHEKNIVQDIKSGNSYVNNELLITLNSTNSEDDLDSFLSDIGAEIVGEIPEIAEYQVLLDDEYTYKELLDLCSDLEKKDWVISATLNYALAIDPSFKPNDKEWKKTWGKIPDGTNWGLEAISVTDAWDQKGKMQNINIGVIDNMFDLYHEDLLFAETPLGMATINSELSENKCKWSNHGTHTAGTITALFNNKKGITGIMPESNLYGVAVKGLGAASVTTLQIWKIAFYYLIAVNDCKVINISLGHDELCFNASRKSKAALSATKNYSNEVAEFLQLLIDSDYDFVICKSAGNQNEVGGSYQYFEKDSDDKNIAYDFYSYSDYTKFLNGEEGYEYFERYKDRQEEIEARLDSGNVSADFDFLASITNEEVRDRIIIVGAVENQVTHKEGGFLGFGNKTIHDGYKIASFSQCGKAVDILAPGVDIYSTIQNGYGKMSGTSMAAPHVSGVAGLVFAINPDIDGKTVKEIICSSTEGQYGEEEYGLLNARKAVDAAINYTDVDETDNEETDKVETLVATEEDFKNLEEMLSACYCLGFEYDFDLEQISTQDVLEKYITGGGVPDGTYTYFYDETVQYDEGENVYSSHLAEDPEGRFISAYKLEAEKADWIVENVFEKSPDRSDVSEQYYYKDDFLYINGELGGGPCCIYKVVEKYLLEDETYGVSVMEYWDIGTEDDPYQDVNINYYVCKLKEDENYGRYWSILKGSNNERCFELPTGEKDKTDIFLEYKNALTKACDTHKNENPSEFGLIIDYYTLWDVNNDGIKELFVHLGTCEADATYYVYTLKNNKAVSCGELPGSHSGLYLVNGNLYKFNVHMGNWAESKIFLKNGQIEEEITFSKYYQGDYEKRDGDRIEMSSIYSHTELVNELLGL